MNRFTMDRFTRRQLLEQTFLGMAAAMTASTAGALSLTTPRDRTGRNRVIGANGRVKIAVIGANGRGMDHVKAWTSREDVDLVAICDVDTNVIAKVQDFCDKRGKPKPDGFQDIRKLVDRDDIDAVSIATPNHWHSLAAIWALQHGKDVYVEKPVSHNVSEGRRLVEVAHKLKRVCQAGTQSRSAKACQDAVAYIHSGKLGTVTLAQGLCYKPRASIGVAGGPQAPPATVDYDLWLGPAPEKPVLRKHFHYDWHWFWDYGCGDLGNQGIHQMDIARWALGKSGLPHSVVGLGGRFGYQDDGETPNTELTLYDYGDTQLIFEVRGLKTDGIHGVRIGDIVYGSEGSVVFSDDYGKAAAYDNDNMLVQQFIGGGDHFGNFIEAVKAGSSASLHAEVLEGHISSALCHLGNVSYRLGEPQPFNPKTKIFGENPAAYEAIGRFEDHLTANGLNLTDTSYTLGPRLKIDSGAERFIGNSAANALLTREYRKGFEVPARA